MLVSDIVSRVRSIIGDADGSRWPDARVITLIDECQKDICREIEPLRTSKSIVLHDKQSNYTLPTDYYRVARVTYNNQALEFKSRIEMDSRDSSWAINEGTPKYVVYDNFNREVISLSPIPSFTEPAVFDITTAETIEVIYSRIPDTVTALTDTLDLGDLYISMFEFYVSGRLFREDFDTQNRAFGAEQLGIYSSKLVKMSTEVARDFTGNLAIYDTGYRKGV